MRRPRLDTLCFRCGLAADGGVDAKGRATCAACLEKAQPAPASPRNAPSPAPACAACGYDLTGLSSSQCPECGAPVPEAPVAKEPTPPRRSASAQSRRPRVVQTYEVLEGEAGSATRAPCPCCHAAMKPGEVRCSHCGTLPAVYTVIAETGSARTLAIPCRECGYDLRGLPKPICPECGAVGSQSPPDEDRETLSAQELASEVRRPLLISVVSTVSLLGLLLLTQSPAVAGKALLALPFQVLLASVGFWFSSAWISQDPPMWLVLVRMLAIVPSSLIVPAILAATGLPAAAWVGSVLGLIVFWFMVAELFDLDFNDGRLVLAVNCVLWMVLQSVLVWLL